MAHAYDDLYYLERTCMHQVIAQSTGRPLAPVNAALSMRVAAQIQGEREQSDLFFEALRRMLPQVQSRRAFPVVNPPASRHVRAQPRMDAHAQSGKQLTDDDDF